MILPNLAAGCSMADMADIDSVTECWEQLEEVFGTEPDADGRVPVIPVTYMNSSAALKGFCGEHGGIVCTSSNAATVLEWAFERGQRVLFFPDQHLGRNTAKAMGVPLEQMPMWNPRKDLGGNDEQALLDSRVILWHGFCSVHKRFNVGQIEKARAEFPGVQVIVHPECPMEVVDAADSAGSTDFIKKAIAAATEPTTFAIGTEINMVQPARRGIPAAHHLLPGPGDLPLLHDVPHPPRLPRLGPGSARPRRGAQPHHRGRGRRRPGQGGPGAHAGGAAVTRRLVIVGSGIAGLYAALLATDDAATGGRDIEVVLLSKGTLEQSNTFYAQGGISAVLAPEDAAPGDSVAAHIADTLAAGAGLNDAEAVRVLCTEAVRDIAGLGRYGVHFDAGPDGGPALGLEAAHSAPRILHAGGDATGACIARGLVAAVLERAVLDRAGHGRLRVETSAFVTDS